MPIGKKSEPEGPIVSPVEFYPGSNGEAPPEPPTPQQIKAYALWRQIVEEKHRRLGMTRRQFAESAGGMAAAMLVLNQTGCGSESGGQVQSDAAATTGGDAAAPGLPPVRGGDAGGGAPEAGGGTPDGGPPEVSADATEDPAAARELLAGDQLIVDVHTHPPNGRLLAPWPPQSPQQEALDYIKMMFVQSDTAVAVLTGWPRARDANEANVRANATLQEIVDRLGGARYLFHANADPDLTGEPEYIEKLANDFKNIAAWKVYPHETPNMRLHQRTDFLERVRRTGVKIIAAHRGLHGNGGYEHPGSPEDVVRAALMFPDINFLMYHSGYEPGNDENHPYMDLGAETKGVDRFVKAMLWAQALNGGKRLENVYADLGTTWAQVMGNEGAAGHLIGKLLKYVGPDKILHGTDAFNGSMTPSPQIARMRLFDIPERMREPPLSYPSITPDVRRMIFGLNAVAAYGLDAQAIRYRIKDDDVAKLKMAYRADPRSVPMPHPHRYRGPRTRREFLAFREYERRTWG